LEARLLEAVRGFFFARGELTMSNRKSPPRIVTVMDADAVRRAITRIAHEILERNKGTEGLALVGIRTRGVHVADRIATVIQSIEGVEVPRGVVDITRYRDDAPSSGRAPIADPTSLPFEVANASIVLCDDVLYTGRTTRAAMEAIIQQGRPALVALAVLVDRGHRELPIRPDFVGKHLPTSRSESVEVKLTETDSLDEVCIVKTE
jgi:pyrimidine operon attenuation protein/uracil phosphoribosyltransferase